MLDVGVAEVVEGGVLANACAVPAMATSAVNIAKLSIPRVIGVLYRINLLISPPLAS